MSERITEITARNGLMYRCAIFSTEDDFDVRLFWGGRRIGYLKSMRLGCVMQLSDIRIEYINDLPTRRQGLGSTLLELLMKHAQQLGCEAIMGNVFPEDVVETSGLLTWCKECGFQVTRKGSVYTLHRAVV